MDFSSLGIDIGMVVAIGAITEFIKKQDTSQKLKRFYILLPVLFSIFAACGIAISTSNYGSIIVDSIKFFGISSFGYSFIKKTIIGK